LTKTDINANSRPLKLEGGIPAQIGSGMNFPAVKLVEIFSPDDWEGFTEEYVGYVVPAYIKTMRFTGPGRVARPFAFHKIVSAPRFNTTPARPHRVKILKLGCPVLDALQGRGFCFNLPPVVGHTKKPRPTKCVGRGTPTSTTKPGPPAYLMDLFR
jgi:hypothetical protein